MGGLGVCETLVVDWVFVRQQCRAECLWDTSGGLGVCVETLVVGWVFVRHQWWTGCL